MAALRIAAILGDDYHDPEGQKSALKKAIRDLSAEMDSFTDPLSLPWDSLSQWGMVVVAREGRRTPKKSKEVWFTPFHERLISAFVHSGGALVALHAGLASYGHDGDYGRLIHGSFIHHPEEHPEFQVRPTPVSHEITDEVGEFSLRDEMYFVRVDSAQTTVLMESCSPNYGSSAAAWAHQAGQGRVFCFTPGHRDEVFANPGYRSILARGLRWAAGAK